MTCFHLWLLHAIAVGSAGAIPQSFSRQGWLHIPSALRFCARPKCRWQNMTALRNFYRRTGGADLCLEESEVPDGFPYPKTYVCAALASRSEVIGADGLRYRCGLQVGERLHAVGTIRSGGDQHFPDRDWWERFDP